MGETEGAGNRTRNNSQASTFSAKLYFDSCTWSWSIYGERYAPWHAARNVLCRSPG